MSAATLEVAAPGRQGVIPAALAAFAESAVLFLPLQLVVHESALRSSGGPLGSYPAFVAVFTLGVALATAGRRSRVFVPLAIAAATGVGLAQAAWWGGGGSGGAATAVGLSLAVAVRAVTLALRDWRDPVEASFGWGAGVVVAEAVIRPDRVWAALAPAVVAQFFLGSLASRAASFRLAEAVDAHAGRAAGAGSKGSVRSLNVRAGAVALGAAALVAGLAAFLGGAGGALARLGRFIPIGFYGLVYAATFVLAQVLRPIGWVLRRLGFQGGGPAAFFKRLSGTLQRLGRGSSHSAQAGPVNRLFGLVLAASVLTLLVITIARQRRRWALGAKELPKREEPKPVEVAVAERPSRRRRAPRRELPEDAVRRLYAETLVALERKGLARPGTSTPEEHLREVVRAVPESAGSLTALTRAYEDVRYGLRPFDREAVDRLTAHRDLVLEALRRAPSPAP